MPISKNVPNGFCLLVPCLCVIQTHWIRFAPLWPKKAANVTVCDFWNLIIKVIAAFALASWIACSWGNQPARHIQTANREALVEKWDPWSTTSSNYQQWESATQEMKLLAPDRYRQDCCSTDIWLQLTHFQANPLSQSLSYKFLTYRVSEHNRWLLVASKFGVIFGITLDSWNRLNVLNITEINDF